VSKVLTLGERDGVGIVSECYFIVILAMVLRWDGFDAYMHAYNDEVENGNGVWIEIVHMMVSSSLGLGCGHIVSKQINYHKPTNSPVML